MITVGCFVKFAPFGHAVALKGRVMSESMLGGAPAFVVKTPRGEYTVLASLCEPLPKKAP